ncbi:hypothetical protein [Hyphomonas sp.]|uniref:hypothetical protein n=1 Tax=Hyphomonas sp. TaxID=87 RepID=UPI003002979F
MTGLEERVAVHETFWIGSDARLYSIKPGLLTNRGRETICWTEPHSWFAPNFGWDVYLSDRFGLGAAMLNAVQEG